MILFLLLGGFSKSVFWTIFIFIISFSAYYINPQIFLVPIEQKEVLYNNLSFVFLFFLIYMFKKQGDKFQEKLNSVILGSVIHDLRIPMSTIKNYAYALEVNPNREIGTKITGVINESFKLVDEYLLSLKNADSYKSKIDAGDFIKNFLADYANKNYDLKITFEVQKSFYINVNPFLFKQVFINLFENAKYALKAKQDKLIEIKIYTFASKGYINFKDYGCGIQEQNIDSIFDPFFTNKKNGKGMGLAFCKNILSKMKMEIYCKSEYKKYTEFIISSDIGD